jgi:hypothetical protein
LIFGNIVIGKRHNKDVEEDYNCDTYFEDLSGHKIKKEAPKPVLRSNVELKGWVLGNNKFLQVPPINLFVA